MSSGKKTKSIKKIVPEESTPKKSSDIFLQTLGGGEQQALIENISIENTPNKSVIIYNDAFDVPMEDY